MTSSKECGFTFTWITENTKYLALRSELVSPKFIANCLSKTEWHLAFSYRPDEKRQKLELFLQLRKEPTEPYNIVIMFELLLFDANNVIVRTFRFCNPRGFYFHRGNASLEYDVSRFSNVKAIQCRMWLPNTNFCDTEQSFGRTRLCIERRHFMWNYTNVNPLEKEEVFMTVNSKKCPSKSINLILNTSRIGERKLQVQLINNFTCRPFSCENGFCIPWPFINDCQISAVDSKGNVIFFPEQEKWKIEEASIPNKITKNKCHDKYYFQFPLNSAGKDLKDSSTPNGFLSFQCECDICFGLELNQLEDANSVPIECTDNIAKRQDGCKTATSTETSSSNFMKDMQQLCTEKEFSDFSLKTETEIFPVHRAILGVRSPVFKAMFSHDMKESEIMSVDVPDLSADTVRKMLLYIYTDKVENVLWKDAFDLYIAGDKYQMLSLKERCSSILKANLHPSNVCQIFVLSDERHDEDLKIAAQDYIVDHDTEIVHLDAWKDIERSNPKLGVDVLRQIVVKRQNV